MQDKSLPEAFSIWGQDNSLVERLAKGVGVLAAFALTTAFLVDCVFYFRVDRRLLGYFVLTDHIETAVYCLLPIFFISVGMLSVGFGFAFLIRRWAGKNSKFQLLTLLGVFGTAGFITWGINEASDLSGVGSSQFVQVSSLLAGLVIVAFLVWRCRVGRVEQPSKSILVTETKAFPFVWFATAGFFGFLTADRIMSKLDCNDLISQDTVMVAQGDEPHVASTKHVGHVIRVVDKGVILATLGPPTKFAFFPKESVRNVEFGKKLRTGCTGVPLGFRAID